MYFSISFTFLPSFQHVSISSPATVPQKSILGTRWFGYIVLGDRWGGFSYKGPQEMTAGCRGLLIRTRSSAMWKTKVVVPKIHHIRGVHVTALHRRSSEGGKLQNACSLQLAEERLCVNSWSLKLSTAAWEGDVVVYPCPTHSWLHWYLQCEN